MPVQAGVFYLQTTRYPQIFNAFLTIVVRQLSATGISL